MRIILTNMEIYSGFLEPSSILIVTWFRGTKKRGVEAKLLNGASRG